MLKLKGSKELIKKGLKEHKLTKKEFWKKDYSDFTKLVIKDLVKEISLSHYEISDTFDWSKVEFFVKTLEQFFKELMISTKKIQPNDLYDFFNTVYVQPNDKYFTDEDYWIKIFKQAGLDDYLFENN